MIMFAIKCLIGALLLLTLIPIILILYLLLKVLASFETYENEMKKWHDDNPEGWLSWNIMQQQRIM